MSLYPASCPLRLPSLTVADLLPFAAAFSLVVIADLDPDTVQPSSYRQGACDTSRGPSVLGPQPDVKSYTHSIVFSITIPLQAKRVLKAELRQAAGGHAGGLAGKRLLT